MLSSAALILLRAVLSLVYTSDTASSWWFQLFVTWLPDVPPCLAYLVLMWPRDEETDAATSEKVRRCVRRCAAPAGAGVRVAVGVRVGAGAGGVGRAPSEEVRSARA